MRSTIRNETSVKKGRSRITNARSLFPRRLDGVSIDNRGVWTRRLRDLVRLYSSDAGGDDSISEGLRALIRRIATLQCAMERMEAVWARDEGEGITSSDLDTYQRLSNTSRRLIESAGLKTRAPKDVTPDLKDYVASKYGGPTRSSRERIVTIDHDDEAD